MPRNGITLITLIITIIIMLIIAGVTIGITTDRDGLIDKAKEQIDETNDRIAKDEEATQGIIDEIKGELDVNVSGVVLDTTSVTLKIGDTKTLTATVVPQNSPNKVVTWSSSDSSVVTVNNGLITAIKTGTAVITVTTQEGNESASCRVTVGEAVQDVILSSNNITIAKGDTQTLTATITPENATNKNATWSSSDSQVATVDSNGIVTAVNGGTATITVITEDGGKVASCEVNVITPQVTLSATTGEIEAEKTLVLTASLNVTPTQNIVWTSSDDTIATVVGSGTNNTTGTITGIKAGGPVTITATYGDKTATCSVTVTEKLLRFTIDGKEYSSIEGWDWYTWINSGYNVDNYSINKSKNITNKDGDKLVFGLWNHPVLGLRDGIVTTGDYIYEYDYTLQE